MTSTSRTGRVPAGTLFLASATTLFVELLFIRWISSEMPVFAYFKNFPLLAAFAGLGAGCLLGASRRSHWASGLAAMAVLAALTGCADLVGWHNIAFPEPRLDMWGNAFDVSFPPSVWAANLGKILLVLGLCAWSFVGLGQTVGALLRKGPPLAMYTADILGSLAGVVGFAMLSFLQSPPYVWLAAALAMIWFLGMRLGLWTPARLGVLAVLGLSVVLTLWRTNSHEGVLRWSPYYRIEVQRIRASYAPRAELYFLDVNRAFHQTMIDLSNARRGDYPAGSRDRLAWEGWRLHYDLPFIFKRAPESVLIGGAGAGNDAAGALRNGARSVTAVEIDPGILEIGRTMHPSRPYDSPRIRTVCADIRSFLRRSPDKFDLIIYGILDSHTALSSLSSLRLDNYVYTVEGLRDAFGHLAPGGMMFLSFFEAERVWLGRRIYRSIQEGTGVAPVPVKLGTGAMFIFGPGMDTDAVRSRLRGAGLRPADAEYRDITARPSTDDWPFLYSNPAGQPLVYFLSLALLAMFGAGLVFWALHAARVPAAAGLDWPMFFLGAGFMLVETKALAEISLLFGSTWIVNTFVFAGVFLMILLANWAVRAGWGGKLGVHWVLLSVSLALWYFFPRAALNTLGYWPRAAIGTLLTVLPLFFAGTVFATLFSGRREANNAFGSNLSGAVVGGVFEAASLTFGIRALTLIALAFYGGAWLTGRMWGAGKRGLALKGG